MAARKRQRKSTQNVGEDYYDILDVPVKAKPEEIKDSYLRLVRLFPPETHAAEFEQIRRAYEVLRNPQERKRYDLVRKYGSSVDEMFARANELVREDKLKQAEQILRTAKEMDPSHFGVRVFLSSLALQRGDDRQFRAEIDDLLTQEHTDENRATIHIIAARMLLDEGRVEQALAELSLAASKFPAQKAEIERNRVNVLRRVERYDEALELVNANIRDLQKDTPGDLFWFILRVDLLVDMERWQDWSQVQTRVRRFFRCLATAEDRQAAIDDLVEKHDTWSEDGYTRGALAFLDLALYLKPKDKALLESRRELEEQLRFERELDRLMGDRHVIPLVMYYLVQWVVEDTEDDSLRDLLDDMERELAPLLRQEERFHEEIAAGILRLRRHYPTLHRRYESAWSELYDSHVGHLNREMRRRLR